MQVNINIDDTQMSKLINDGINALDDETAEQPAEDDRHQNADDIERNHHR